MINRSLGPCTPRVPKWQAIDTIEERGRIMNFTPDQMQVCYAYLDRKYKEKEDEERRWKERERQEYWDRRKDDVGTDE